ncbi:hypothetical protein MKX01_014038 [Papaver californicum]|nr:hypothetical protein MKX01_014038 [Papaver californicum]
MDERGESDFEREEEKEDESTSNKNNMEISEQVMGCISDFAFKISKQLANDLELFAQHAGRKSVNIDEVILSAHRNEHLASSLRFFSSELNGKEPQSEKKRKKTSKKTKLPLG